MSIIHKVVLDPPRPGDEHITHVRMPVDPVMLDVAFQGNELVLWYTHSGKQPEMLRTILVAPTGMDVGYHVTRLEVQYIGTAIDQRGGLVFHVFDLDGDT